MELEELLFRETLHWYWKVSTDYMNKRWRNIGKNEENTMLAEWDSMREMHEDEARFRVCYSLIERVCLENRYWEWKDRVLKLLGTETESLYTKMWEEIAGAIRKDEETQREERMKKMWEERIEEDEHDGETEKDDRGIPAASAGSGAADGREEGS